MYKTPNPFWNVLYVFFTDQLVASGLAVCHTFGRNWNAAKITQGALVCTKHNVHWKECTACYAWILVVWENRGWELEGLDDRYGTSSTLAGKYYCRNMDMCTMTDASYIYAGDWSSKNIMVLIDK